MEIRHRVSAAWEIGRSAVELFDGKLPVKLKGKIYRTGQHWCMGQTHGQQRNAEKRDWR